MFRSGTKKIITIGSIVLFIIIFLHLIGVYIFSWWHYEWVKWGSISIGIVDAAPDAMNPFQYGQNSNADLVYRFLFRGLIRYDVTKGIYQGDITNCDLSDISYIRCNMQDDAIWSDGTRIKSEDIIASIDAFKRNTTNEDVQAFLNTVKVTKNGESIEIRSTEKNPRMIDILTYPIIKTDVINAIGSGTVNPANYITSGPYILSESILDKEYWFDRITLIRNEKFSKQPWLDKIHFKFFRDSSSLERSSEALTIVIPPLKNENIDIGPRFREYLYSNYEYFSVFLNTKTISRVLRNNIHWQIGTSFSWNIAEDHHKIDTIFSTGWALLPSGNLKSFPDVMREIGYIKKNEILTKAEQISTTVSSEIVFNPVKYWKNKASVDTLFVNEAPGEIILTGVVPENTQSVIVNGYALKEFIPGNTQFSYKVSALWGTLLEGKNTYTLSFVQSNGNTTSETLNLYISADQSKLDNYKKELQEIFNATQNTAALVANRERAKEEKIKQIQDLKDEYYYNDKNEVFVLKIAYIVWPQSTESYAQKINESLKLLGIKTELIPFWAKDIESMIASGEKKYDILVIGISVEWSLSSIAQLFASSEARTKWLNFSSIESKSLDSLFSEFRSTTDSRELEKIQQSIIKIMNSESFFVPISSPYHRIWVDRNIKWMPKLDLIPDIASFVDVFIGTSIKENYILNTQGKNISGFFDWLIMKL